MSTISSTSSSGAAPIVSVQFSSSTPAIKSTASTLGAGKEMSEPPVPVVVSLDIPLLSPEKLYPTPSIVDGLPYEVEFDLRLTGCELIQTTGRLLKLPQVSLAK